MRRRRRRFGQRWCANGGAVGPSGVDDERRGLHGLARRSGIRGARGGSLLATPGGHVRSRLSSGAARSHRGPWLGTRRPRRRVARGARRRRRGFLIPRRPPRLRAARARGCRATGSRCAAWPLRCRAAGCRCAGPARRWRAAHGARARRRPAPSSRSARREWVPAFSGSRSSRWVRRSAPCDRVRALARPRTGRGTRAAAGRAGHGCTGTWCCSACRCRRCAAARGRAPSRRFSDSLRGSPLARSDGRVRLGVPRRARGRRRPRTRRTRWVEARTRRTRRRSSGGRRRSRRRRVGRAASGRGSRVDAGCFVQTARRASGTGLTRTDRPHLVSHVFEQLFAARDLRRVEHEALANQRAGALDRPAHSGDERGPETLARTGGGSEEIVAAGQRQTARELLRRKRPGQILLVALKKQRNRNVASGFCQPGRQLVVTLPRALQRLGLRGNHHDHGVSAPEQQLTPIAQRDLPRCR
jgi:hypothetical protein